LRHCVSLYLLIYDSVPVFAGFPLYSGDFGYGFRLLPALGQILYGGLQEGLAGYVERAKGNSGADHSSDNYSQVATFVWWVGQPFRGIVSVSLHP
jgi:hypothetical protein